MEEQRRTNHMVVVSDIDRAKLAAMAAVGDRSIPKQLHRLIGEAFKRWEGERGECGPAESDQTRT
jgi:hypothetical protein